MSNVATIFARKGGFNHWSLEPEQTVLEVLQMMADHNVGSIVVCDADNYLGIFIERNYSRNVILKKPPFFRHEDVICNHKAYCVEI